MTWGLESRDVREPKALSWTSKEEQDEGSVPGGCSESRVSQGGEEPSSLCVMVGAQQGARLDWKQGKKMRVKLDMGVPPAWGNLQWVDGQLPSFKDLEDNNGEE